MYRVEPSIEVKRAEFQHYFGRRGLGLSRCGVVSREERLHQPAPPLRARRPSPVNRVALDQRGEERASCWSAIGLKQCGTGGEVLIVGRDHKKIRDFAGPQRLGVGVVIFLKQVPQRLDGWTARLGVEN